jgi:hypothetical protein
MSKADINRQVAAGELVDHEFRVLRKIDALPEQPRIGSFATGLASGEPRPWSSKQMVGDERKPRRPGASESPGQERRQSLPPAA